MVSSEPQTDRLQLRRWLPADRAPFAMNADPKVTEYLPGPLFPKDSDLVVARIGRTSTSTASVFGPWRSAT